jgi:glycosyltransferase involved in cell wall biosynthesis
MRILYLHQYFNTPDMPGSTRSYEMGRRLVAAGHHVEIVTSWRQPRAAKGWETTEVAGMQVHWLAVQYSNQMSYRERIVAFLKFAMGAAGRATRIRADVIFASSTPLTIALPAVYAARRQGIPMVLEVRDLWPEMPIAVGALKSPVLRMAARWLERFAYAHAAGVVALSPGMAAGVAHAGYPSVRIAIVPNAADLDFFKRDVARGREFRRGLGIDDEKIVVGYAGTLGRINGVAYLAHVAAALKQDARFVFVVVGDGQERAEIEAVARDQGVLNHNFLIHGQMAKTAMNAVFSAIDIATSLFLPIREMESNSANKFFDALSAGCCVAINYGGWQAELLDKAQAGMRLSNDPKTAAQQLKQLAEDPQRLRTFGCNARRLAVERFSRDNLAAILEAALVKVVAEGRRNV